MKTISITAYAANPYKGTEDAKGWKMIMEAARYYNTLVVTHEDNRADIERYMNENYESNNLLSRLTFVYYDLPIWMVRLKRIPSLEILYYYAWQFTIAFWMRNRGYRVDMVQNAAYYNPQTPSFLWVLGKPIVPTPVNVEDQPKTYVFSFTAG